jgi:hypothetical protein
MAAEKNMNYARNKNSQASLTVGRWSENNTDRFVLAFILVLHVAATCMYLPPSQVLQHEPLYYVDHPVHTHRVHIYRSGLLESGLPWGYDPAVSAGLVMYPMEDLGAKPHEFVSIILLLLPPGMVVRLFLFLSVLTAPLWMLLACRRLSIPGRIQTWTMVVLISLTWLYFSNPNFSIIYYFHLGLVAFAVAGYFAPYVLTLFLNFCSRPDVKMYLAFCLSAAAMFLLHIIGPVAILPPLILYTLIYHPLAWRWRIALFAAPLVVLALNIFWVFPYLLTYMMPLSPLTPLPTLDTVYHWRYASFSELSMFVKPYWIMSRLIFLGFVIYGFFVMRKIVALHVVVSFALAAAFCLILSYFGSFIPVFAGMQPVRFIVPGLVLLSLPLGAALSTIVQRLRLPVSFSAMGISIILALITVFTSRLVSMPLPPNPNLLADFIERQTVPSDRLLIQSRDGYRYEGFEARVFPLAFDREVIGCSYPATHDPVQFSHNRLLGRDLMSWSIEDLRLSLDRWGVSWAFTQTDDAKDLFSEMTGNSGIAIGEYYAFRVADSTSRFLIGKGNVYAKVNRLELKGLTPENGLIVLRYRYHPAWKTDTGTPVEQYHVPEDLKGFISLRNPPTEVTLRFDPWAMLHEPWPERKQTNMSVN